MSSDCSANIFEVNKYKSDSRKKIQKNWDTYKAFLSDYHYHESKNPSKKYKGL
jgi:uncharacterized membrane protein